MLLPSFFQLCLGDLSVHCMRSSTITQNYLLSTHLLLSKITVVETRVSDEKGMNPVVITITNLRKENARDRKRTNHPKHTARNTRGKY